MKRVEARFIGLMLGDGCLGGSGGRCKLTAGYHEGAEIEKFLYRLCWNWSKWVGPTAVQYQFSRRVTEFLGWQEGKRIPRVEEFGLDLLGEVVGGCFDSDGHAHLQGGLEFQNKDEDLSKFVWEALIVLGIKASLRRNERHDRKVDESRGFKERDRLMFRVRVGAELENLKRFKEKVGFVLDEKMRRLNLQIERRS